MVVLAFQASSCCCLYTLTLFAIESSYGGLKQEISFPRDRNLRGLNGCGVQPPSGYGRGGMGRAKLTPPLIKRHFQVVLSMSPFELHPGVVRPENSNWSREAHGWVPTQRGLVRPVPTSSKGTVEGVHKHGSRGLPAHTCGFPFRCARARLHLPRKTLLTRQTGLETSDRSHTLSARASCRLAVA